MLLKPAIKGLQEKSTIIKMIGQFFKESATILDDFYTLPLLIFSISQVGKTTITTKNLQRLSVKKARAYSVNCQYK